jgi:hypothetical protein
MKKPRISEAFGMVLVTRDGKENAPAMRGVRRAADPVYSAM